MKLASTYELISDLDFKAGMELLKKNGYQGVELYSSSFTKNPVVDGKARKLFKEEMPALCEEAEYYDKIAREAGLEVIGLCPPCFTMSFFEDDFFENYYLLAKSIGAPALKVAGSIYMPSGKTTYWEQLKESRRKLEVLIGFGEKYGVRTLIELHHGYLNESCSGAYNLLRGLDHELVGVIHDPQNMILAGKEGWRMGLEILGGYLAYVHVKNSIFRKMEDGKWKWELSLLKDGLVNWEEFIQALKDVGFGGYLCNEYMGDKKSTPRKVYLEDEMKYIQNLISS